MLVDLTQQSSDWVKWREGGLGGSDVAAILEEAKFSATREGYDAGFANSRRYGLWLLKTGRIEKREPGKAMRAGTANEDKIRLTYIAYTQPEFAEGSPACFTYDDWPVARVSLDYWVASLRHIAEFKSPQSEEEHRGAKEGQIPYYYWLQCQMELAVADGLTLDYVSWYEGDMQIIPVARDEEFWFLTMLPALQEFWGLVEANHYPPPCGDVINDSPEIAMALETLAEAKWREREAKEMERSAYAVLKRAVGGAKSLTCNGQKINWVSFKEYERTAVSKVDPALQLRITRQ